MTKEKIYTMMGSFFKEDQKDRAYNLLGLCVDSMTGGPAERFIPYQDVIDLGFERIDDNDTVHSREYGFEYFRVELQLARRIWAEWCCTSRTVRIINLNKDADIIGQIDIKSLDELKSLIKFFKGKD